ncbi:MAG: anti-sigma factor, partial [Anaerolineales bacterium]
TPSDTPTSTATPTNTPSPTPTPLPTFGEVIFRTSTQPGDTVVLTATGLAPLPAGEAYNAYLYAPDTQRWLRLGEIPIDGGGNGVVTFTGNQSLYPTYSAMAISVEPAGSVHSPPLGDILYSGALNTAKREALTQIFGQWTPEDPAQNPRNQSLIAIARAEYGFAEDHANFALIDSQRGFAPGTRVHAEHVYNILQGGEEDINADNSFGNNPSNLQVGLLVALNAINDLLIEAAIADGVNAERQALVVNVQTCANNALVWSQSAFMLAEEFAVIQDIGDTLSRIETWYADIVPIGPGQDRDEDGIIQPIEGECGIDSIETFAPGISIIDIEEGRVAEIAE